MKLKINKMKHKNNFLIFIFSTILVILISIFYHPNYIFAMNKNKNIAAVSFSSYQKKISLSSNSKKKIVDILKKIVDILSKLENKLLELEDRINLYLINKFIKINGIIFVNK
ncbi:MAG: putative secreted protein [Candidatus Phytoplasma cynodontis]|nr:MAG: putative secreted protein [Candidatus Phytoplasma cynodontis]